MAGTAAAGRGVMAGVQGHGSGLRAAFRYRVAGVVLLATHLSIVGWLTLRPLSVPWVTAETLQPLGTIRADLALGPWQAVHSIGGGLLLLAPLGVLLPIAGGRLTVRPLVSLVRTVFTGAMVAVLVELVRSGVTGQVMSVDSVLLNTAGVALAHLALVPALRAWVRRRCERRRSSALPRDEGTPVVPRSLSGVGVAP